MILMGKIWSNGNNGVGNRRHSGIDAIKEK